MEGLLLGPAELGLQPPESRQLSQPLQHGLNACVWTADGAVDPFFSQQDRAEDPLLLRQSLELLLQPRQVLHGGEAIEGHHQGAHAGTCSCQGFTPARANNCWSASTSGFPVVSRVSP